MKRMLCLIAVAACAPAAPPASPHAGPPAVPVDRVAMAARVKHEAQVAWHAYATYAWGHDELKPVSHTPHDWYAQPLLMTPVDGLDTLVMLGLTDEANAARKLIDDQLSFDRDIEVKNFEITIRILGGLISGYQLTGDAKLLALADDLGTRLSPVFRSPTGMPYMFVNLRTGKVSGARSNPAEIGTLLLEFGALAKLTHKPAYYDQAKRALVALYDRRSPIGLVGEEIDVETGKWLSPNSHVGGGIDSYYEYLLKAALLFDDADCLRMWQSSLAALNHYIADDTHGGLWYGQVDMTSGVRTATEYGALHAFFPALLVLAGELDRARKLADSGFRMWQLRGLEPETIDYATMVIREPGYQLRPEIIESAWYLRRATGDSRYLTMGKTFFDGLVAHSKVGDDGYTVVTSVDTMARGDLMPSYFFAETLKYLYLIFAPDDAIDLHLAIFNTEAHPIRRTW